MFIEKLTKIFRKDKNDSVLLTAGFCVNYCAANNYFVNLTKLQKLTYAVYGTCLAVYNTRICDRPKLWGHGPFFEEIYEFTDRIDPIDDILKYYLDNHERFLSRFTESQIYSMENVLSYFCKFYAKELVTWSTSEKSAWYNDLNKGLKMRSEMSDESIKEYFKSILK